MNNSCSNCLLLYFDILGYKEEIFINSPQFLNVIQQSITAIKNIVNTFSENFKIKIFSDNAVISISNSEENLQNLISLAMMIQTSLMQNELLIRGSITSGEFYIDDNCVYGNALVRAVELEHEAKYPRIIIDKNIKTEEFIDNHLCLKDSFDDYTFVNFLGLNSAFQKIDFNSMNPNIINSPMDLINVDIEKIKEFITKASEKNCNYDNIKSNDFTGINNIERKFFKYLWLIEYFNKFCSTSNHAEEIRYTLILCKNVMKINLKIL